MTSHLSRRHWLRRAIGSGCSLALPLRGQAQAERAGHSLMVVPQFTAADVHRDWTPLLQRLSAECNATLTLKLAASIPRFEADVLAGLPDFAYLNPYHAVMAMRAHGYLPLVRDEKPLTGILVVRRDDPIKSVRELDGKELAFPAPNAFGASLWMRALLAERERVQVTPSYVQTHSNVYRQVLRGKAAAGGGVRATLMQEADDVRTELRVLLETPPAAPHPLVAHPRVPARLRQAVAEALLRWPLNPAGEALLQAAALPHPVLADYDRDYRPLERYRLERYAVLDRAG